VTVLEEFADWIVAERERPLRPDVIDAATRAVVDWFSATVPGARMDPAIVLQRALCDGRSGGGARLVGSGARCETRTAALINATASHTPELDDIYREGIYHPGSPTVGAALALAEQLDASGPQLLRAVTVGYEVGDRIAAAINPAHYRFWHTTGTVGTLGAAAAGASLLGLDRDATAHALATATTMAAGLQQAFRSESMSKPLHAGHAAEAGLLSALAAGAGFTGALDVLEGDAGLGVAMSDAPDWQAAIAGIGSFHVTEATVKDHSCCGHTFASVDAMAEHRAAGLTADDVSGIEIETYATALEVAGNPDPATAFEAKFSIAYCVAAELVLGGVRLRAFEDAALTDPTIRRLIAMTTVGVDTEYDALFPGRRAARVTVTDTGGRRHVRERLTRKGDPDDPLDDDELRAKFDELVTPILGESGSRRLAGQLWGLRELASVCELAFAGDAVAA
jgi:2-methylcitrate dehydratase PrpD